MHAAHPSQQGLNGQPLVLDELLGLSRLPAAGGALSLCCMAALHALEEEGEGPVQPESCPALSLSHLPQVLLPAWPVVDPLLKATACRSERLALGLCLFLQTLAICLCRVGQV